MTFSDGSLAELLQGQARVVGILFACSASGPSLGRDFTEADGRPGSPPS